MKQFRILVLAFFLPWLTAFFPIPPLDRYLSQQVSIERIQKACELIQHNYYDQKRIDPEKMLKKGFFALSRQIPEVLITFKNENTIVVTVSDHVAEIPFTKPVKLSDIKDPLSKVFGFINDNYKGSVSTADREYAFINGILETLDPHSNLLTPDLFKEFRTQTEGEYGGIGIVVGIKDDELTVIAPIEGTPAAEAGIQTDDKIQKIDDLSTVNMSLSEAVERLRGKVNSKVTLLIARKGVEPHEVTLTRKIITIVSVKSKLITKGNKNFAVLKIISFQEDTFADMDKALEEIMAKVPKLDGIILDLRNNPGGLLDQALRISDKFIDHGDLLFTANGAGDEEETTATKGGDVVDCPMIVLVNQGSASASEIVAGALKGNDRAMILGQRTFGKGSVQTLYPLKDGSSLKITVAQYLTPGKISIQAIGITPDIEILPARITKDGFFLRQDESFGEKDLEEHLDNSKYWENSRPVFSMSYFDTSDPEVESEYVSKINETGDYLLSTALKILEKNSEISRSSLIDASLPQFKKIADEQDHALILSLKKKGGIDWKKSSLPMPAILEFKSQFLNKQTGKPVKEITAGEEITWQVTATNKGTTDVLRLIGVVKSAIPFFKGREFVFGQIKEGKFKTATVTFKVPEEAVSYTEDMTFDFYAGDSPLPLEYHVPVSILEHPQPLFTYSYQYNDDGTNGSVGNGNHIPEKGETIALDLVLKNVSNIDATNVTANIRNTEGDGVLLKKGRDTFGMLKANMRHESVMLFEILPTYPKDELKLGVSFVDKKTRTYLEDSIVFPMKAEKQDELNPKEAVFQQAPIVTVDQVERSQQEVTINGVVSDDQSLLDVMIFVGDEKVYYQAAEPASVKMDFKGVVPLKEGANTVTIQVRDNRKIVSNKMMLFVVPKTRKDAKP